MTDLIFPENEEFHRLWHLQTHATKWKLYTKDEIDLFRKIIEDLNPKSIIDWGCGLARTSVSLFKYFELKDVTWTLCDLTGSKVDKWVDDKGNKIGNGMGTFDNSDPQPYNDLSLTKEFCNVNGLTNVIIKDINTTTDLGSPDLLFSMHCVGYHFSIKSTLEKLNVTPKIMVFGIRKNKLKNTYDVVDVDEIPGYEKSIIKGNFLQDYLIFKKK